MRREAIAPDTRACAAMKSPRSCSRVPRTAWATIALPLKAPVHDGTPARIARAPPPSSAAPYWSTSVRSWSRVLEFSVARISSNWTGVAVWASGIVPPSGTSRAAPVPGWRSTKKLPSRKMRGRIFIVASAWIGRPASATAIATTAVPAGPRFTPVTRPTFTPAMRTGELRCSSLAEENTPCTT